MNITPTKNIEQAIKHIKALPIQEQQSVFTYIDELIIKLQENNQKSHEKRHFGLYQDKGEFRLSDDFEMTEEELIGIK